MLPPSLRIPPILTLGPGPASARGGIARWGLLLIATIWSEGRFVLGDERRQIVWIFVELFI